MPPKKPINLTLPKSFVEFESTTPETRETTQERLKNEVAKCQVILDSEIEKIEIVQKDKAGVISKVRHLPTNTIMLMKEFEITSDEMSLRRTIREVSILRACTSEHVISFYGAYMREPHILYCLENMECGSLDKLSLGGVPESILAKIAISVIKGLKYLKEHLNIVHQDVRPSNIAGNEKGQIKLSGFGISGEFIQSLENNYVGYPLYMPPENVDSDAEKFDSRSDIWNVGISLIEIGNGKYPYPTSNVFHQLNAISNGPNPTLDPQFSDEAQDFINKCLNKDPSLRATYQELLEHPWLVKHSSSSAPDDDLSNWLKEAAMASRH